MSLGRGRLAKWKFPCLVAGNVELYSSAVGPPSRSLPFPCGSQYPRPVMKEKLPSKTPDIPRAPCPLRDRDELGKMDHPASGGPRPKPSVFSGWRRQFHPRRGAGSGWEARTTEALHSSFKRSRRWESEMGGIALKVPSRILPFICPSPCTEEAAP